MWLANFWALRILNQIATKRKHTWRVGWIATVLVPRIRHKTSNGENFNLKISGRFVILWHTLPSSPDDLLLGSQRDSSSMPRRPRSSHFDLMFQSSKELVTFELPHLPIPGKRSQYYGYKTIVLNTLTTKVRSAVTVGMSLAGRAVPTIACDKPKRKLFSNLPPPGFRLASFCFLGMGGPVPKRSNYLSGWQTIRRPVELGQTWHSPSLHCFPINRRDDRTIWTKRYMLTRKSFMTRLLGLKPLFGISKHLDGM